MSLVSIIIPTFNRATLLKATLGSVICQTYQNWECIIVDDGSNDDTEEVVREHLLADNRFRYYQRDRFPKGAAVCRNIGIKEALGEFIIFLDSDDLLAPYCLEVRVEKFSASKNDFEVYPMMYFTSSILDTDTLVSKSSSKDDLTRFIGYDFPWTITSPIWQKSALVELGGFNENTIGGGQDWELHIRALLSGKSYQKHMDQLPDSFYRIHSNERISSNPTYDKIKSRENLYWNILHLLRESKQLTDERKHYFGSVFLQLVCLPLLKTNAGESMQVWNKLCEQLSLNALIKKMVVIYLTINHKVTNQFPFLDKLIRRICIYPVAPKFFLSTMKASPSRATKEQMQSIRKMIYEDTARTI